MSPPSHLLAPPDPALWKDVLFFERFDVVAQETATPGGLAAAWDRMGESGSLRSAMAAIDTGRS